ncbi:MAG: TIGR00266 family protein [Acidobacteria bacterium]|nr:MAG: TIGR00266 family protein [Acidobacteriota bacterium]
MSDKVWYVSVGGKQQGPHSLEELAPRFRSGELSRSTYVYGPGMENWMAAGDRPELAAFFDGGSATVPPISSPGDDAPAPAVAHDIDYEIFGEEMQFVEITLDPGEACLSEAGAFMYMDPGIRMETIFGDGSAAQGGGLMGMLMSAGKRVLTGESLFMTVFANQAGSRQRVAFAAPYPGRIIAVDLRQHGRTVLCQKDAFLCSAKGISVGIAFQKRLGAGFFGGEGFILQKLEGDGLAFMHAGGTVVERSLGPGETMRLDTGCLVAFEQQVSYDIEMVKGIKSMFFGGEGMFYAALTGPGKVWIQSLPFSRLARRIYAAAPQTGGKRRGEGSVLGGLGDLVMGDRD